MGVDGDQVQEIAYPPGKTRLDLNNLLHEFFNLSKK